MFAPGTYQRQAGHDVWHLAFLGWFEGLLGLEAREPPSRARLQSLLSSPAWVSRCSTGQKIDVRAGGLPAPGTPPPLPRGPAALELSGCRYSELRRRRDPRAASQKWPKPRNAVQQPKKESPGLSSFTQANTLVLTVCGVFALPPRLLSPQLPGPLGEGCPQAPALVLAREPLSSSS